MKTVQAVYEDGVFRPIGPVTLPEKTRVEFEPRVLEPRQSEAMLEVFEILVALLRFRGTRLGRSAQRAPAMKLVLQGRN